jgi:hypothetical protein
MKAYLTNAGKKRGSVLVCVMVIVFLLGLGLASYLTLMRHQHLSVVRSQAWNAALAMAEAGIEEALAQLNPSALLFSTNINRGANGWSLSLDGMYHAPRRNFSEGYYDVAITADVYPRIYATGYVTIPAISTTVARKVVVNTAERGIFRAAMAARVNIDLKGNNIWTDSFDSLDPNYSTGGLYDPAKRKAGGDVATAAGLINVQNADVRGTLYTGPVGNVAIGSEGSVGDLSWPVGGGLQDGHWKNDFNMDFPDVLPPYQSGLAPTTWDDKVNGTNYTLLGNGNYMVDNAKPLKFSSGDVILVTGRAKLYVTGDFIMGGQSQIIITPGASLQLYVGGQNAEFQTINNGGNCATFSYFGLPGNTSINLAGNSLLLGTIYAPNAALTLAGSGDPKTPFDFQGACAVNTIKLNGHFNFHFDENLKRKGPVRGYQITAWSEI